MRNPVQALIVALVLVAAGGLLIVGITTIRESATRMRCSNNLKQIGLACDNYRSTYGGHFPRATEPNSQLPPERRLSWLVGIQPFVEASDLLARLERDKGWDEENRYLALTVLRNLHCPAAIDQPPVGALIPTHYVGIAGLGPSAASLPRKDARAGVFGYDRTLFYSDIEGHASTLLLAIETTRLRGAWSAGGPATVRGLDEDDLPYLGRAGQFGGTHRGGALAAFADGSARFMADSVDPTVLEALATIEGSATAGPLDPQ